VIESKKKYCYREVDFYKEAYIGVLFLKEDRGEKYIYPLNLIYQNKKKLITKLKRLKSEIDKDKKNESEVYGAMVMKIKLKRTSPLNKEFWETKAEIVLDKTYRVKQYLKMFSDGEKLYEIMVLPAFYDKKKNGWLLTNWLPVIRNITDEELGKIAVMSGETQVDSSAKNMALYTIEWVKGVDVETWELVEKENTGSIKTEFDC